MACPASFQTGGTEALHVLAFELRKLGVDAIMFYRDVDPNQDVVGERFKCFNIPYVLDIEDKPDNILVVPEIQVALLKKYKHLSLFVVYFKQCFSLFIPIITVKS